MKLVNRSHVLIVVGLILVATGIWAARVVLIQASAEALKPAMVTHSGNIIDPRTGDEGVDPAVDFDEGKDESTFAVMYHGEGADSQVLFYDFDDPQEAADDFVVNVIYSFDQVEGDDGFSIEYSSLGNTSCSDASSRTWLPLAEVHEKTGRTHVHADMSDTSADQVCVRFDQLVNEDADHPGFEFQDSNRLNIFDIWLEVPVADIEMNVETDALKFAEGEQFVYHVDASNVGSGKAEEVQASFPLPDHVAYERSASGRGWYDPISGGWDIGTLGPGETASLDVIVQLIDGHPGDHLQANASVRYLDVTQEEQKSHANSARVVIADAPTGIAIQDRVADALAQSNPNQAADQDSDQGAQDETGADTTSANEASAGGGEEAVTEGVPEEPVAVSEPETCDVACEKTGFYLYIVNPDGTTRDTLSDFARVTAFEDRFFRVSFEDKGSDFDYNDIAFELDLRDCRNVRVTMTDLNAGWHHQVAAKVYYDDELHKNLLLWGDSHQGFGQTLTLDLSEHVNVCQ